MKPLYDEYEYFIVQPQIPADTADNILKWVAKLKGAVAGQ